MTRNISTIAGQFFETQTDGNGCCMQIAEVELLAVTDSVDCEKASFLTQPVDTPVGVGRFGSHVLRRE